MAEWAGSTLVAPCDEMRGFAVEVYGNDVSLHFVALNEWWHLNSLFFINISKDLPKKIK